MRLDYLAQRQHGAISRSQALSAGLSSSQIASRCRSQAWEPLAPGVYRLVGAVPSWHQQLMTAILRVGGDAVVSHRAASCLWQLGGVPPGAVEVSVGRGGRRHAGDVVIHWTDVLDRIDRARVGGLPVTTATRTLVDLAAVAGSDALEAAVESALHQRLTSLFLLRSRLDALGARQRPGVAHLRRILGQRPVGAPSESELETKFVRLLRAASVPLPIRQYDVRDQAGTFIGRADLAYPERKVLIELDGWNVHHHQLAFEGDLRRQNALIRAGWRPLRFTWERLSQPDQVVAELEEVLVS